MDKGNVRSDGLRNSLSVLLLCDYRKDIAETVRDHIDAFAEFSRNSIRILSVLGDVPNGLDLTRFDVVVVHYSLVLSSNAYVSPRMRGLLAAYTGLKVVFIQDEYRHVDATISTIREIGSHILFSCVPVNEIRKVYGALQDAGVTVLNCLTGYVPSRLVGVTTPEMESREIDVGYRARRVPAWLGELGQEKTRIGERFLDDSKRYGLRCDISSSEEDRLYGAEWTNFVSSCKAMLGVESGASVFDFSGDIQRQVESHVMKFPNASYEEVKRLYFAGREGSIVLNQVSPRCFEAACLRTLMILYPGHYSGVLEPWRHYIPLAKDHSNMDEVVRSLRDPKVSSGIVERTYREIALDERLSYRSFVSGFDEAIENGFARLHRPRVPGYNDGEFSAVSRRSLAERMRRWERDCVDRVYRFVFRTLLGGLPASRRETVKQRMRLLWRFIRLR